MRSGRFKIGDPPREQVRVVCRLARKVTVRCRAGAASGNLHAHDEECSRHTSRSTAWPNCAGQPAVCVDPCYGPAGGEIEYVCAAAECIDPWLGAGVGPLEAPAAREAEGFGATLHEDDHLQGISGDFVAHPEFCASPVRVNRHPKADRFFPSIRILHPLPCHRFDARTRGRSPVR